MLGTFLDGARRAVDRREQTTIGFEMVEPGPATDGFCLRIRVLHVRKHGVQLLRALLDLDPAERANTVGIVVREVNTYPAVRIGRIAPKATKLLSPWRQAFWGRLREEGLCASHSFVVRLQRQQVCRVCGPLRCDGRVVPASEAKTTVEVGVVRDRVSEGQRCRGSDRLSKA